MNERVTLRRLATLLRLLSVGLFVGTVAELLMAEHYADLIQLVPFALCGIGLLTLGWDWRRPSRGSVLALRAVMAAITVGSLVGVYQHVRGNLGFVREVQPNADWRTLLQDTLTGGAPIGASGILVVGAVLALAASYANGAQAPADATATDTHGSHVGGTSSVSRRRREPRGGRSGARDLA